MNSRIFNGLPTILVAVLLVARNPDAFFKPEFWAEDGANFFRESWNWGMGSLLYPLGGYQNLIPRLWAYLVSFFPVLWTPMLYAGFSLGVSSFCLGYFSRPGFAWLVPQYRVRVLVCIGFALVPGSLEVTQAICNLHTVATLWVALWALEDTPPKKWQHFVLFVLLVLSVPELPIVVPLLLFRWWSTRRREFLVGVGVVLAGAVLNSVLSKIYRGESYGMEFVQIPWAMWVGAERLVLHSLVLPLLGPKAAGLWLQSELPVFLIGMLGGVSLWAWSLWRQPRTVGLAAVMIGAGAISFSLLVLARPYLWPLLDGARADIFWNSRYGFVSVSLSLVIWAMLSSAPTTWPQRLGKMGLGLILLHLVLTPQRPETRPDLDWPATANALSTTAGPVPVPLQPGAYATISVPGKGH